MHEPIPPEAKKRGRPKKVKGRGKGRPPKRWFYVAKSGTQGTDKPIKRAAARGARDRTRKLLSPQSLPTKVSPVGEKDIWNAIAVLVKRGGHLGKDRDEWPSICSEIAKVTKVDPRRIEDVLERLAEGDESPETRRPGAGRKA